MFFWHLGATVAIIRYAFRDDRMDLRFLLVGAVLSDVIDTPIGLIGYDSLGGVRLVAHSLLFAAALMVVVLLSTRRGRPRKRWMPLAVGLFMHLFLDAMWSDPETLWWPFLGLDFSPSGAGDAAAHVAAVLSDWRVWALEAVGLAYLIVLGRRARLADPSARRQLLTVGTVDAPIERR